jgi:hypothetical protein
MGQEKVMHNELYADAIGEITVTGGIVRIDLVSLSPTHKDAAGQPVSELRQRLIMSIEGFANSFEVIQKAMHGLIEAGAIRRTLPDERSAAGAAGQPQNGAAKPNGAARQSPSPNFA